jgi:centromere/kinetochore protein ZW10
VYASINRLTDVCQDEIRRTSREAASDVDGWIAQARKLQGDIKRSQETAHDIVKQAEAARERASRVQDATSKVSLLYSEIAYNETLVQVVERLRDISTLLDAAQDAAVHGNVLHALDRLEDADTAFKSLESFESTRAVGVLQTKASQLRAAIVEDVTDSWNALLTVDSSARRTSFKETIESTMARPVPRSGMLTRVGDAPIAIDTVVEALTKLGLLDRFIATLSRDFDKVVVAPRLAFGPDRIVSSFVVEGDDIQVDGHVRDMSVKAALEDIHSIAEYLSTRLPPSVAIPLSSKLVPTISGRLISNWLLPAVPLSTDGVHDFQETLSYVLGLAEYLDELDWSGQDRLRDWVDQSAQIWLARQKEAAIVRLHSLCPRRVREKKTVERVETQMVTKGDAVLGHQEDHDEEWGAEWGDHDQATNDEETAKEEKPAAAQDIEEEDMSAWDDEAEAHEEPEPDEQRKENVDAEEEDVEAWGWGDEGETQPAPAPTAPPKASGTQDGNAIQQSNSAKEVTLRETYTVTAIPDAIMEIIMQVVSDVHTLNQPGLPQVAIAPSSVGLYAIPTLVLAMYRATAASHYSKDVAGNMLIYNDCSRLSDRLRTFLQEQLERDKSSDLPPQLRPSARLKFDDDIRAIERFGKRAYGREMESQRTIIKDLLSGAQGFKSCTTAPFDAECDNAIAMTVDRIEEVKRQWQNVLSHSALLQSLGSLVSTALTKFIGDVEEISDIAEEESKKLHSYCKSLSSLSSLFQTENASGEPQDMTSIYTPNWFKFQYLGEILDSSLADIRYFWTDGELKLEMEAEEVVELIKALFAESEHRRKAISEIRRTSMR